MSQLVITTAGRLALVQTMMQRSSAQPVDARISLFKNDVIPNRNSNFATFTPLLTDPESLPLDNGDWQTPTIVANNASMTYGSAPLVFTVDEPDETVYGYFVWDNNTEIAYWAERVDTPFAVEDGQEVKVVPKIVLGSIFDPTPP